MAKPLLPDASWDRIRPLPPPPEPKRPDRPGRKRLHDRRCLVGILLVLRTGIPREDQPMEMGCGSGMACWRHLGYWTRCGVWRRLHELLLAELEYAGQIDWERAAVDSASLRARGGGEATGPSPVGRRKKGSKHFAVVDGGGKPLATRTTAANRPDVSELKGSVDAVPPVRGKRGRPRRRPDAMDADRGSDSKAHRRGLPRRGLTPRFARRGTPHGSGLGEVRWVVERTLSWLFHFGRLSVRRDRSAGVHQGFVDLAASIICFRQLPEGQLC
ncbi:IS5 family transposase [Tautonia plasticadhaerens]|uniref:IS5 family transposase n=1 Tax=Tautonia plasticadhaerens TaxID=2527974 RepID=UPI0036F2D3AA